MLKGSHSILICSNTKPGIFANRSIRNDVIVNSCLISIIYSNLLSLLIRFHLWLITRHIITKSIGVFLILCNINCGNLLFAQKNPIREQSNGFHQDKDTSKLWKDLSPYFSPPPILDGNFGNYTSPLFFANGKKVENEKDWRKRREEILRNWHGLMGEWPEINQSPEYEILEIVEKEGYWQKKIKFDWVPGQTTVGYLLVPFEASNSPAVITVYYEPETAAGLGNKDQKDRDFALQLTKRGFVTLSLGTAETTKNQTYAIYYPDIQQAQVEPLSMLAYAAATSWHLLSGMPEIDASRIGIMGHSYGGKWAMFASCLYEKFAAAVWSDPGIVFQKDRPSINYWEPWYLGYHSPPWRKRGIPDGDNPAYGLYPELLEKGMDLHELHVLMAPRPFLVSGGSEDPVERWIPLNHSLKINKLLGFDDRVGMTNRPDHSPDPESNEYIYNFFAYFLYENPGLKKIRTDN